ncbi:MAG: T9SS type A sorting domain-containing protein [Ignavibacteriales bacterium]|nr:T9SS type A sorting domain-containing protein [Ignavibacteriales bacterium]
MKLSKTFSMYAHLKSVLIIFLFFLPFYNIDAQWSDDPSVNTLISFGEDRSDYAPTMVNDGEGGAIICWRKEVLSSDSIIVLAHLYAQKIDKDGFMQWDSVGIPIYQPNNFPHQVFEHQMIPDGAGGAIIVWQDFLLYAQRIDASGNLLWGENGICLAPGQNNSNQLQPKIINDGSGGAIITFTKWIPETTDIYAQHISALGELLWSDQGKPVVTSDFKEYYSELISNGSGGAIICWIRSIDVEDQLPFVTTYAQHIDQTGQRLWDTAGIPICTEPISNSNIKPSSITNDGNGGAYISWLDIRNDHSGILSKVYIQKINSTGVVAWATNGIPIAEIDYAFGSTIQITSDNHDGAILSWSDGYGKLFMQRIDDSGTPLWKNTMLGNGEIGDLISPTLFSTPQGGAIIGYNGTVDEIMVDIRAQKLNPEGIKEWADEGVLVTMNYGISSMISDQKGGAIIAWADTRSRLSDIYVQSVHTSGKLSKPKPPQLSRRANSSTNQPRSLLLAWYTVKSADTYTFQFGTDPLFTPDKMSTTMILNNSSLTETSTPVNSLDYNRTYYWRVQATNDAGASDWSDVWHFTTCPEGTSEYLINAGWNIISLPLEVINSQPSELYPLAISKTYSYSSNKYIDQPTIISGEGYWLKFDELQYVPIIGNPITAIDIDLIEGWNLVGSITNTLNTNDITTTPGGLITSFFWGFNTSYNITDILEPGKGYWVKSSGTGKLHLAAPTTIAKSGIDVNKILQQCYDTLTVEDNAQNRHKLYFGLKMNDGIDQNQFELPPSPPAGVFDVRFSSQKSLETNTLGRLKEVPILISTDNYPVTIQWRNIHTQYLPMKLKIGDAEFDLSVDNESEVTNCDTKITLIMDGTTALPTQFALSQNYPNPFNPATEIKFMIHEALQTSLQVFDLLGKEVAILVNEVKQPGTYTANWDAGNFPSGVYYYRLKSGNHIETKKLILIK